MAASSWKAFPSLDIPEMFNYGHAYHYLVESISQFGSDNYSDSEEDSDNDWSGYTTTAKLLRKGRKLVLYNINKHDGHSLLKIFH